MALALFDLDNTLLDGDSDQLWADYLGSAGIVNIAQNASRMASFHGQYLSGTLDVREYLAFSLGLIRHIPLPELRRLRQPFIEQWIRPRIRDEARQLIRQHQALAHRLVIITLTNRFISEPIATEFGIAVLLATEPEIVGEHLTGQIVGDPCYQRGKIAHLGQWMRANGEDLNGSYFYSDSINDLPLLETVSCPVVVNPDPQLAEIARERGWLRRDLSAGTVTTE